MIDLNLFKTFVTIHQMGSVRAAADVMNLTPSAVSHALNRLRDEYNNPLFVRDGRGLKPTAYANELYKEVTPHLIALEGTKKIFEGFNPSTSDRTFYIAGDSDLDLWYFHKLLEVTKVKAPNVKIVKFSSENREESFNNALSLRKADVLISVVNPNNQSFMVEEVVEDKMVAIASKHHPRLTNSLSLSEFVTEKHAVWSRPDIDRNNFENLVNQKLPKVDIAYGSTAAMNLIFMVSKCEWVSIIPEFLYKKTEMLNLVNQFELPFKCKKLPLHLINHKATEKDMGVQWLKGMIRDAFRETKKEIE